MHQQLDRYLLLRNMCKLLYVVLYAFYTATTRLSRWRSRAAEAETSDNGQGQGPRLAMAMMASANQDDRSGSRAPGQCRVERLFLKDVLHILSGFHGKRHRHSLFQLKLSSNKFCTDKVRECRFKKKKNPRLNLMLSKTLFKL